MKTVPCCLLKSTARELLNRFPFPNKQDHTAQYQPQYQAARPMSIAQLNIGQLEKGTRLRVRQPCRSQMTMPVIARQGRMAELLLPLLHSRAVAAIAAVDAAYLIPLLPVSAAQRWPCYRPQCQRPLYDSGWGWSASFSPAMPQVNRNFNIII